MYDLPRLTRIKDDTPTMHKVESRRTYFRPMRIPLTATGRFCFGFETFPTEVILCRFALEVLHFSPAM